MSSFPPIEVNHLSFNQNSSCIAMGTRNGFSIFNLDPIEMRFNHVGEGLGKIEMLYCTSLLALVGSGEQPGSSPRKFRLWNSQNKEMICELSFPSSILNLKLNRERLVICLETQVHVYELSTMKCLQVLTTLPNPLGLFTLSSENSSYLAFPSGSAGGIVLYDCISLRLMGQIDTHKNCVVAMSFNSTGTILATASVSGTVVRLFNIPAGNHLCTFRRGSRPSEIHTLSFSNDTSLLVACSSSGTVHIFDVSSALFKSAAHPADAASPPGPSKHVRNRSQSMDSNSSNGGTESWANSWANSAFTYVSMAQSWGMSAVSGLNVLPEPLQEYADSIRAVAVARIPTTALGPPGQHIPGGFYQACVIQSSLDDILLDDQLPGPDPPEIVKGKGNKVYKIVAVTKTKQLFRFTVPANVQELTALQMTGEESTMIQCLLEDEAILE